MDRVRNGFFDLPWRVLWITLVFVSLPGLLPTAPARDYSRLVELAKTQQREETPLYVFRGYEEDHREVEAQRLMDYFPQHPQLVRQIREDLGRGELGWRLDHLERRLLFVPETQMEYAVLFEGYCKDAVTYTLKKTGLPNPYGRIETLLEERPETEHGGITVFLVHGLAEELQSSFVFSNRRNESLMIDLSSRVFLGELGSYVTYLSPGEDGSVEFSADSYTIWQTRGENVYTLLTVPVEETLHIGVRQDTHRAIRGQIMRDHATGREEEKAITEDWMAVEEGFVGGIVHAIVPPLLEEREEDPSILGLGGEIKRDLLEKKRYPKYRYLEQAIEIIEEMGTEEALEMYAREPTAFRSLLTAR